MYSAPLAALLITAASVSNAGAASVDAQQKGLEAVQALAPEAFTVLIEGPFIVAGDETPAVVRQRAQTTVRYAVDRLKQEFFAREPDGVIAIWLFKDKASYESNTRRLFHETPYTPYGYYSAQRQALIMNIATGGGTLIHEIVHAFIRTNFPACPAWFNEGLASLFEQSDDRAGHIHGLPNWRLPGLQDAIRAENILAFETFTAMSDAEFYSGRTGYNEHYGQARYLCYYLQERKLLVKFYREFLAHANVDPTGLQSLKATLGTDDLAAFQSKWEAFVLKLRFP